MPKEVMLVFQDCPFCAPREDWARKQKEIAKRNGIKIVPASFNAPGIKGLILKAKSRGVEAVPFFTDGSKFSYSLEDFVGGKVATPDTPAEANARATRRKAKAAVKGEVNGEESEQKA